MAIVISIEQQKAKKNYMWSLAKPHRSFDSVKSLDQSVAAFLSVHGAKLSPGAESVLKHLMRHSVKILGVSFGKVKYIAETASVSEPTVQRAIRLLESLGILKRIPTKTAKGGQGVNLIVIQPFQAPAEYGDDTRDDTPDDAPPGADEPRRDKASEAISASRNEFKAIKTNYDDSNIDVSPFIDFASDYRMPEKICLEIAKSLRQRLDQRELECNRNDLKNSFRRATSRFVSLYRNAYHISSFSSFYIYLFRKELQRCKDLRAAG